VKLSDLGERGLIAELERRGLARGLSLAEAARGAAAAASDAVLHGLAELGAGEGPVDVLGLHEAL